MHYLSRLGKINYADVTSQLDLFLQHVGFGNIRGEQGIRKQYFISVNSCWNVSQHLTQRARSFSKLDIPFADGIQILKVSASVYSYISPVTINIKQVRQVERRTSERKKVC